MLVSQLLYLSRATASIDHAELTDIASISARNNGCINVTGVLLYCNGYFLQILEGDAATIDRLLAKITQDPRHVDVEVVQRRNNAPRDFAGWAMAGLHWESMSGDELSRANKCIAMIADPTLVDRIGNDAHHLLVDLQFALKAA